MTNDPNRQGTQETGNQSPQNTNEDLSKKTPGSNDYQKTPEASIGQDKTDSLQDETPGFGDTDGNGNMVSESDDHVIGDPQKDRQEIGDEDTDEELTTDEDNDEDTKEKNTDEEEI